MRVHVAPVGPPSRANRPCGEAQVVVHLDDQVPVDGVAPRRQGARHIEDAHPDEVVPTRLSQCPGIFEQPAQRLADTPVAGPKGRHQVDLAAVAPQPLVGVRRRGHELVDGDLARGPHVVRALPGPVADIALESPGGGAVQAPGIPRASCRRAPRPGAGLGPTNDRPVRSTRAVGPGSVRRGRAPRGAWCEGRRARHSPIRRRRNGWAPDRWRRRRPRWRRRSRTDRRWGTPTR